jgi:hypothetical protein
LIVIETKKKVINNVHVLRSHNRLAFVHLKQIVVITIVRPNNNNQSK